LTDSSHTTYNPKAALRELTDTLMATLGREQTRTVTKLKTR